MSKITPMTSQEPRPAQTPKWQLQQEIRKLCIGENTRAIDQWIETHQEFIDEPGEKGKTLEYCVIFNKPKALVHLLLQGFLETKKEESNLLVKAASCGYSKSVISLLKLGFNPHFETKEGVNALREAARGGHYAATRTLLKVGVKPNTANHQELLAASISQKNETLRLILDVYPKTILEKISCGELEPAKESTLPFVIQRGMAARKRADELTKKMAEAVIKDASSEKMQKFIQQSNTLEI